MVLRVRSFHGGASLETAGVIILASLLLPSVQAQSPCPPIICSNPYGAQTLGGGGSATGRTQPTASPLPLDVDEFASMTANVFVPYFPTTLDNTVQTSYYTSFTALMQFTNNVQPPYPPDTWWPVTMLATLDFEITSAAPMGGQYVAYIALTIGDSNATIYQHRMGPMVLPATASLSPVYFALVNTNTIDGLEVSVFDSAGDGINLVSGFQPTGMQSGATATVGMVVETTKPGGLNATACSVLPNYPQTTATVNTIELYSVAGQIPLQLVAGEPQTDWCALSVGVDNSDATVTFQWAANTQSFSSP